MQGFSLAIGGFPACRKMHQRCKTVGRAVVGYIQNGDYNIIIKPSKLYKVVHCPKLANIILCRSYIFGSLQRVPANKLEPM